MFLYIALGFTLQQGKMNNMHLCPYASDTGSTCMMSNLTHAQHWLSFISSNIPEVVGVLLAIILLYIGFKFRKTLFNFFHKIETRLETVSDYYPPNFYTKNVFLSGTLGSRAP
jgi:hypothetical protein